MKDDELIVLIYDQLYRVGLTVNYAGFFHIAHAVLLAYRDPTKLRVTTKQLYPEVADYYKTTWHAVERNIRYSINILWKEHPNRLSDLAGHQLIKRPTPTKFIALLVAKLAQVVPQ